GALQRGTGVASADDKLVEERARKRRLPASARREALRRAMRALEIEPSQSPQPLLAEQTEVDGDGEGDQPVVCADVGRRALAADVLFARGERQDVAAPAGLVARFTDPPARHAAHVLHTR